MLVSYLSSEPELPDYYNPLRSEEAEAASVLPYNPAVLAEIQAQSGG